MNPELPRPSLALVVVTQALLGVLFLLGIGTVALLPAFSAQLAESLPEYAGLRPPLLALAIGFMVLALIVLAMIALLIDRIRRGTVLTRASLLWVDGIVAALACAVVLVITGVVVISNGQAGNPLLALIHLLTVLALVVLACITLVLRSLLRHAILLRSELDEVV
ncbi:DUF2975 domain-containing protein [Protaetiibacter larvae]|uniref:DUF2975 domain-containing protein n=1 Tax=Protaetiibacter larvae TaxID=2592654 RepID=A0A5C1Y8U2_9MICO|nr:DUF2975 domain-containing protein [Protaetiibacter larvae]QEO09655.1 DUF2975 domain-containing protein [Protaetiibacter larvae]